MERLPSCQGSIRKPIYIQRKKYFFISLEKNKKSLAYTEVVETLATFHKIAYNISKYKALQGFQEVVTFLKLGQL